MKVSTSQMFNRAVSQMATQQGKVSELQAKMSLGKQLVQPSDDPQKAALIQRLTSAYKRQEVYQSTIDSINNRLIAEESALMASDNILQRIRELAVRAGNETLSAADRNIIAAEVSGLRDELLALANTRDVSGNYVFAGSMVQTQPFAPEVSGEIVYLGDDQEIMVNVSDQRSLVFNRPGMQIYASIIRQQADGTQVRQGFFKVIDDFVIGLQDNDTDVIQQGLSQVAELTQTMALAIADVGGRMQVAASQTEILTDAKTRYEMLLSNVEDLDYTKAITELTQEMLSLEAGQSSFAKISQLSLFDYIR